MVSFNDERTFDQVLVTGFASAMDGKGFAVDLGVPFFNFCQATASTLNGFSSMVFRLHSNQCLDIGPSIYQKLRILASFLVSQDSVT